MQFFEEIPDHLIEWILKQEIFWVASAPLSKEGHVNISPKGVQGTFHVTDSSQVWYEDLSGSGAETISHIRENGRVTVLFNAFEGPPRIARLYGRGTIYEFGSPEYDNLLPAGVRQPGSRAAIVIDVFKVGTTCGYSVPFYSFVGHRNQLLDWAARKEGSDRKNNEASEQGMKRWWADRNTSSMDGLPALRSAHKSTASTLPPQTAYPPDSEMAARVKSVQTLPKVAAFPFRRPTAGNEPRSVDITHLITFFTGVLVTILYLRIF